MTTDEWRTRYVAQWADNRTDLIACLLGASPPSKEHRRASDADLLPVEPCTRAECGHTCVSNRDGTFTRDLVSVSGGIVTDGEGPCRCEHHGGES